jgi:DNA polymerase-4
LAGWTDSTATVYDTAVQLYRGLGLDRPRIRLLGVKCENLRAAGDVPEQLTFDDALAGALAADRPRADAADAVIDAARAKFGAAAVGYATLLPRSARQASPVPRERPTGAETGHGPRNLSTSWPDRNFRSGETPRMLEGDSRFATKPRRAATVDPNDDP